MLSHFISFIGKHARWLGWLLLLAGLAGYVLPLYYDWLGFRSGLFAFLLIFLGISLLRLRKDQLNKLKQTGKIHPK